MELLQLEAARDYRLGQLGGCPLYFSPLGPATTAAMDDLWRKLTFGEPCRQEALTVLGRELAVPRTSFGAARFAFADLFEKPTAAPDYIALARHYHTIFLDGIPVMGREQRNEARRFITFIDTAYDCRYRAYRIRRGRAARALPRRRWRGAFRAYRVQAHGNAPAAIFARSLPGRPAAPGLSAIGVWRRGHSVYPSPGCFAATLPQGERVCVLVEKASPLPSASACGCGHSKEASSPRRACAGEGQGEG